MGAENTERQVDRIPTATYVLSAILAAIAGFVAIYLTFGPSGNVPSEPAGQGVEPASRTATGEWTSPIAGLNKGEMAALVIHSTPQEIAKVDFVAGDGSAKSLAAWRGKVVLLNLWATWCAPCRKEMPALDRLKADLGGEDFDVVAVSIDKGGLDKPRKFLEQTGVKQLVLYNESSGRIAPALKAFGMPTTLLIDRGGREIARLVGPAEWHSDDAKAVIKAAMGKS